MYICTLQTILTFKDSSLVNISGWVGFFVSSFPRSGPFPSTISLWPSSPSCPPDAPDYSRQYICTYNSTTAHTHTEAAEVHAHSGVIALTLLQRKLCKPNNDQRKGSVQRGLQIREILFVQQISRAGHENVSSLERVQFREVSLYYVHTWFVPWRFSSTISCNHRPITVIAVFSSVHEVWREYLLCTQWPTKFNQSIYGSTVAVQLWCVWIPN